MLNKIPSDAKVLIISWSPVPTPKYQKIEGSGQRFFGLANGLKKNGISDITIAIGEIYPLDVEEVSGFKLFNYGLNEEFAKKLSNYDTIIYNYTIHGSAFINQNLPSSAQVIIDAYGPAYVENLARNPEDTIGTYIGNLLAVKDVFNKVLLRGDYFLYANDAQEKLYTGVLATLGVINQFSYNSKRLIKVPFGIDKPEHVQSVDPYIDYGVNKDTFVLLWFGGLYPWFDITRILRALENNDKRLKLFIVGGNNPQNQHPDFVKNYQDTLKYIKSHSLQDKVVLIDWVDYATRRKYYDYADLIISMNGEGKENVYSWRTRVMDYVGSTTPLITNGGDPLSDELIKCGAAFQIDDYSENHIETLIGELISNKDMLLTASKKMAEIQPKYYWENVTNELAELIQNQSKPYQDEQDFRKQNDISDSSFLENTANGRRYPSLKNLSKKLIKKIRKDGFVTTFIIINDKIKRRLYSKVISHLRPSKPNKPKIIVVSNQLNNTGAPFVIMDVLSQLKTKNPKLAAQVKLICFTPVDGRNVIAMRRQGFDVEVYTNRELMLDLKKGDTVILNTFAISNTTLNSVLDAVDKKLVTKVFWYGHEASPEGFIGEDKIDKLVTLLSKNILKIYTVSEQTNLDYRKFFGTDKNIEKMLFRFLFPNDMFKIREPNDFDILRFTTTGSLMDMRKGQYPIVFAFLDFYHNHFLKKPDLYREFNLELIGAYEKGDTENEAPYHIRNILKQLKTSAKPLGGRFTMTPVLSHNDALKAIDRANVTICYSLMEAMGIFVYEGMATGHPIIRNESAGQTEQLIDGTNGIAVSNEDISSLVDAIEIMLNKSKTTNEDLSRMSRVSNEIAKNATNYEYQIIDELSV